LNILKGGENDGDLQPVITKIVCARNFGLE
jgi:hypothetical protein